ncbi:MAG: acyl carrier protein [Deltaproteobacteria bacterium]|nr:acyl carrier protein [Deltaproteobacteria bacterium]
MQISDIRWRVEQIIRRAKNHHGSRPLPETLLLFGPAAALDSVESLKLVLAVEKEFDICIAEEEIVPEYFATIESLVRFIENRLKTNQMRS